MIDLNKFKCIISLLIIIFFCNLPTFLRAADIYVDAWSGNDSYSGMDWLNAKKSIAAGLALSESLAGPDTVHVAAGTYVENITLVSQTILLGGYPSGGGTRDPAAYETIIDGGAGLTTVRGADNATIDGFTITGGKGENTGTDEVVGGGIACYGTSPTISHNKITGNNITGGTNPKTDTGEDASGAGIYCINSAAVITDNLIETNNAIGGDGLYHAGSASGAGIFCMKSNVQILRNIIRNNKLQGGTGFTTGLSGTGGFCYGAGICLMWSSGTISQNSILANSALGGSSRGYIGGSCYGGGVSTVTDTGGNVLISGNTIKENHAKCGTGSGGDGVTEGAGVWTNSRSGLATDTIVENNLVGYNIAEKSSAYGRDYGGGISSQGIIVNNTIFNNYSQKGGGVAFSESGAIVANNIFIDNSNYAIIEEGLMHSMIPAAIQNNDFYNNTSGVYWTKSKIYLDVISMEADLSYCKNNISCDPGFISGSEYLLAPGSCCIDAGTSLHASATDFDGDTRPIGSGYDIGADEFNASGMVPLQGIYSLLLLVSAFSIYIIMEK